MQGQGARAAADIGGSIVTGIDGNPLAVLAKQMRLPLADIRSGGCSRGSCCRPPPHLRLLPATPVLWTLHKRAGRVRSLRPGGQQVTRLSLARRAAPPRPPADTPLYNADGTEPDAALDTAVEGLFNDLLDECTDMKAFYEGSGGDMPLGEAAG